MAQGADRRAGGKGERVPPQDRGAGGGEDADESGAAGSVGVTHIPGTAFRVLPDGSVARFITSPGSLLDHTIRLQGAVDKVRSRAEPFDDYIIDVLDQWGV